MKLVIATLFCALPIALSSCATSKTESDAATARMAIVHGPGPDRARIQAQAAPIVVAIAAAALDFGIASLKRATLETAGTYEVKTRAAGVARFGIKFPIIHPDSAEIERADVFVVARAIDLEASDNTVGLILLPPKGKDLAEWRGRFSQPLTTFLSHLTTSLTGEDDGPWSRRPDHVNSLRELVEKALFEVAPREDKKDRVTAVSLVAVIDTDAPKDASANDSVWAYQLALRCYSYPLAMAREGNAAVPTKDHPKVKSVLTFLLESPKGYKGSGAHSEYLHEASFQVKPDALRKATPGTWLLPDTAAGWVARSDSLGAAPPSPYVTVRAQLLETNDIKKSLERLGEFLGGVKLKPIDVGID